MKGTKVKSNKGITLVALVITIIILLILAVVAINAVSGDGIIGKAKEAGSSYNEKATAENTELARQLGLIEGAINSEEEIPTGEAFDTSLGKAIRVGQLLYIASGEGTAEVYGDRGDIDYTNVMWSMINVPITSGDIQISSKVKIDGEIYTVTSINMLCFYAMMGGGATNVTSVTIPSSITSINMSTLASCSSLSSININEENKIYSSDNGVLYNKDKTNLIFYPKNKALNNFIIPDSVTSIEIGAFSGCTSLNSIIIPNSVTSIAETAFGGCTNLKNIYIESNNITLGEYATSGRTNVPFFQYFIRQYNICKKCRSSCSFRRRI